MASSNRHWPSMFKKSKPSNQHDVNSTGSQRSPSAAGGDDRSPQPKPRWNPKPEQIRILEAIFNSGMVNPPRDEIRRIRIQLQEYGQVGDANVFYWFQNRKSRSKNKLRPLQNSENKNPEAQKNSASLPQITAPSSSSSSNSEKSSPKEIMPHMGFSMGFSNVNDGVLNSPTPSVNQAYFQTLSETNFQLPPPAAEPFFFPVQDNGSQGVVANAMTTQGFNYLSEFSNMIRPQPQQDVVPYTGMSLSDIMNYGTSSTNDQVQDNAMNIMRNQEPQLSFCLTPTTTDPTVVPPITDTPVTVPSPIPQFQGVGEADGTAATCTVFINDVAFEVVLGPFNVREAFGDQVTFVHSSGLPVLTDEWGFTLYPLQHGASYYLLSV